MSQEGSESISQTLMTEKARRTFAMTREAAIEGVVIVVNNRREKLPAASIRMEISRLQDYMMLLLLSTPSCKAS
jgi:ATP-dependent Lon protease